LESKAKILKVYGDFVLVIHQLNGEGESRDSKLIPYHAYIKELAKKFGKITFHRIPHEDNQLVDALAMLSSMFKIIPDRHMSLIRMQSQDHLAYCQVIGEELDGKPWYHDIKCYIKNKEYPSGSFNNKRTLRRLAMIFFLNGDVLYKKNNDTVLLKCVDSTEAKKILKEIHEESYGTHANGHAMAQKILRAGYYWLTMDNDCCEHVRKCHKCQTYANNIHAPLISLIAPWPFSMWGIDVIGPIELRASNGHRFILVTISPSGWRLLHMLM